MKSIELSLNRMSSDDEASMKRYNEHFKSQIRQENLILK